MASFYPAQIDTSATLPPLKEGQPVSNFITERLRQTIIAIESELGIKPSGFHGTVRSRLDLLENILNNPVSLSGDLGGTIDHPLVIGIQGRLISPNAPTPGQALIWNGAFWGPATIVASSGTSALSGDVIGLSNNNVISKITGNPVMPQNLGFGQNGFALVWNGIDGYWKAQNVALNQSVGGDLGDFLPNPTTRGLWGAKIPQAGSVAPTGFTFSAGSFTVGNVPQIISDTVNNYAIGYGPLLLGTAFASSSVRGVLPAVYQSSQSVTGDLSGSTNSGTGSVNSYGAIVTKIQQIPVTPTSGTLTSNQDGYILSYKHSPQSWIVIPNASIRGKTPCWTV